MPASCVLIRQLVKKIAQSTDGLGSTTSSSSSATCIGAALAAWTPGCDKQPGPGSTAQTGAAGRIVPNKTKNVSKALQIPFLNNLCPDHIVLFSFAPASMAAPSLWLSHSRP